MHTILKWPGGKSREYKNIENLVPNDIDTYIEPFFGGGGIYFHLEPKKSIINDINCNLMDFYQLLKESDRKFHKIIEHIANDWNTLSTIAENVIKDTKKFKGNIDGEKIKSEIKKISEHKDTPRLINGQEKYWKLLLEGLIDKLVRIAELEIKNGVFNERDFYDQIIAVTKGAYYYYIRDLFTPSNKEEEIAQFLFLREFCFGSMFRFNSDGKFNIPYGGASYNNKNLHTKVDYAFSDEVHDLLKNTEINCLDFRKFFGRVNEKMEPKDFCSFDPPYDTEFSEYDKHSFTKNDQEDLAEILANLNCRGLMIIKKTDFISNIYQRQMKRNKKITAQEYGKNYSYNVRGRNERDVTHLLIMNYVPQGTFNKQMSLSL